MESIVPVRIGIKKLGENLRNSRIETFRKKIEKGGNPARVTMRRAKCPPDSLRRFLGAVLFI